jgi:hypothetical protein
MIVNFHLSVQPARQPSTWRRRSEQISLDRLGYEAREIPAAGDVFSLDSYLYRTYEALGGLYFLLTLYM